MIKMIKTQKDLEALKNIEEGMYYIAISGQIATFNGAFSMPLKSAEARMSEIANGQSEMISDAIAMEMTDEAEEALDVVMSTYIIPYRYH